MCGCHAEVWLRMMSRNRQWLQEPWRGFFSSDPGKADDRDGLGGVAVFRLWRWAYMERNKGSKNHFLGLVLP